MGVLNLSELLKQTGITPGKFIVKRGERIAIDAMIVIWKVASVLLKDTAPELAPYKAELTGNVYATYDSWYPEQFNSRITIIAELRESVITGMIEFLSRFIALGVIPVICWDGGIKQFPRNQYKKSRPVTGQSIHSVFNTEDYSYIAYNIEMSGFPCVYAQYNAERPCSCTGEGEKLAVTLASTGAVTGVFTEDYDVLPAGGRILFPREWKPSNEGIIFNSLSADDIHAYYSNLITARKYETTDFIVTCILLGTDFSDRMRGIGPVKAASRLLNSPTSLFDLLDANMHAYAYNFFTLPEELPLVPNIALCSDKMKIAIDFFANCESKRSLILSRIYGSCFVTEKSNNVDVFNYE